jgi:membrane protein YqaA with SNARE-associated domain
MSDTLLFRNYSVKKLLLGLAFFLAFMLIFLALFLSKHELWESFVREYGLLAIFIGEIIANASVLLPVPFDAMVFVYAGTTEHGVVYLAFVGLIAALGASIGELTGYIIGLLGVRTIEHMRKRELEQVKHARKWLRKKGMILIALGALTPFPFDVIGIAAGLIKYRPDKFFIACFIGKLLRYELIVFAGYYSVPAIRHFFGL